MVKFDVLEKLEKDISEKKAADLLRYGNYLIDVQKEEDNTRHRIIEHEGRFYYHGMKDGELVNCFEIAESWRPFKDVVIWAYTPDNYHIIEIDSRYIENHEVKDATIQEPERGDSFCHKDNLIIYRDNEALLLNGKFIKIVSDSEFVYDFKNKEFAKAMGGARELFKFMEHIVFTNGNKLYSHALFSNTIDKFVEVYGHQERG